MPSATAFRSRSGSTSGTWRRSTSCCSRCLGTGSKSRFIFCFDIGHAKVWSTDSLSEWLGFLSELSNEGLRLHFHLHANRGLSDEHLSFLAAERLGITAADSYTGSVDYYGALAEMAERFPSANKVFEVPVQEAEANLDHVLDRIVLVRAAMIHAFAESDEAERGLPSVASCEQAQ